MKDSPTKTICFIHSPKGFNEAEEKILAACKEELRKGHKVILITSMGSQLAVKAVEERVDVYRFRIGSLSYLNPLQVGILFLFFQMKKITEAHFSSPDKKLGKILTTLSLSRLRSR